MGGAAFSFSRFNACFAAGTPIRTPDGFKPIEQLRPGDLVLTRDEHHPDTPVLARAVVGTLGNTAQVLRLIVGEREIRTSAEHPFYVKDRGWRPARLIQPGDDLLTEAGTPISFRFPHTTRMSLTTPCHSSPRCWPRTTPHARCATSGVSSTAPTGPHNGSDSNMLSIPRLRLTDHCTPAIRPRPQAIKALPATRRQPEPVQ